MPSRSAFLVLTSSLTRYPAWNKSKMGSFLYLSKCRHKNMTPANCFFPFVSCRQRDKATLKLYFIVQIRHIKNRIKGNCKNSKLVSQKPSKITTVTHLWLEAWILASILHKTCMVACAHEFRMHWRLSADGTALYVRSVLNYGSILPLLNPWGPFSFHYLPELSLNASKPASCVPFECVHAGITPSKLLDFFKSNLWHEAGEKNRARTRC